MKIGEWSASFKKVQENRIFFVALLDSTGAEVITFTVVELVDARAVLLSVVDLSRRFTVVVLGAGVEDFLATRILDIFLAIKTLLLTVVEETPLLVVGAGVVEVEEISGFRLGFETTPIRCFFIRATFFSEAKFGLTI